jgi:hypothetical protein
MKRRLPSIIAPPALCLALLAGITVEKSRQVTAATADPYHARAKVAVEAIPWYIDGWTGSEVRLPQEAVKLLKPNVILSRKYEDNTGAGVRVREPASLLIVQCKESRDMVGHYPKNCYPSSGWIELSSQPFDGSVGDLNIPATEYHFARTERGRTTRQCVYNFLIVPGTGEIVPDIKGVEQAAEDYQKRYFGAAQVQVLVSSDLPREEREAIYRMLVGASLDAIKTLTSGDVQ